MVKLRDIDLYQVYIKWFQGCGHFRCFFRSTNFVSLKHYPDFTLEEVTVSKDNLFEKLNKVLADYNKKETLFIIDLPGEQSIKLSYLLQENNNIKCILTFNNPLHPFGFVGSEKYISELLTYGENLSEIQPEGYAFILDEDRYREHSQEELQDKFNNQYVLAYECLPSAEMLNALGFRKILYINSNQEIEDIADYLNYLVEREFEVNKVKYREEQFA